jgi:molybdopterin converting factor small subunit
MSDISDAIGYFTLLYFATASSYTKRDSEMFQAPLLLPKLFDILEERYPGIGEKVLCRCAVTINLNYIDMDIIRGEGNKITWIGPVLEDAVVIRQGDEVALIPPVSSG